MVLETHKACLKIPFLGNWIVHDFILKMSFFVGLIVLIVSFFASRKLSLKPSLTQSFLELVIGFCYDLVENSMGNKAKVYFPFLCGIFLFVAISNVIGIIPGLKSPTEDLNVCLSLGLSVFFVSHCSSIRMKGLGAYLKSYTKPFVLMLPLNILGEMGQTISHTFRLFGNIFGGSVIFFLIPVVIFTTIQSLGGPNLVEIPFSQMDVSQLCCYGLILPFVGLLYVIIYAFFGLFAGLIQALVFTLLATVYISLQIAD